MTAFAIDPVVPKRLGLPLRSGGGHLTASKVSDGQAMQDICRQR